MDKLFFMEWITLHRGKIIGAAAGLTLGVSIIIFGVIKTFFVAVCVVLGYLAGKQLDDRVDIKERILRLLGER